MLTLTPRQRADLQTVVDDARLPPLVLIRLRSILLVADGVSLTGVASQLGLTRNAVSKWRRRFASAGVEGLFDRPRAGRPRHVEDHQVASLIAIAVDNRAGGERWTSVRELADVSGISKSSVHRILTSSGLQARRNAAGGPAADSQVLRRLQGVVGLYLAPSVCVLALSIAPGTHHDFAALISPSPTSGSPTGEVAGRPGTTLPLLAAVELGLLGVGNAGVDQSADAGLPAFLNRLNHVVPSDVDVHLILHGRPGWDNSDVCTWLAARPHHHVHSEPDRSAWCRAAGRWFSQALQRAGRRGGQGESRRFQRAVDQLVASVDAHQYFSWLANRASVVTMAGNVQAGPASR